jgi:hypothetical protein
MALQAGMMHTMADVGKSGANRIMSFLKRAISHWTAFTAERKRG